jgi:hypothetical protein
MRRYLPFILLAALSSAALGQSDSLTRHDRPACWRGKPEPACHSFWITEISAEYPYATTSTRYTFAGDAYTYHLTQRDVSPQLFWTVGPMFNKGPDRALGVTMSAGVVSAGSRVAVEARRRYWTAERSAFDLSAGVVRMNVPQHPGSLDTGGYGLTAGAYAVGGDLIHVNARADLVLNGDRLHAGGSVGAGLGGYAAAGATALLGTLLVLAVAAIAHNADF